MARIADRLRRLESRIAQPVAPGRSPDFWLFLKLMHNARVETDRADAEALGYNPDLDFGDGPPEPIPLTEAEERALADEPELEGEGWYLDMLLNLRASAGEDVRPAKLEAIDLAIDHERKEQENGRTR